MPRQSPLAWPYTEIVRELQYLSRKTRSGVHGATREGFSALARHPAVVARMRGDDDEALRRALEVTLKLAAEAIPNDMDRQATLMILGLTAKGRRQDSHARRADAIKRACHEFIHDRHWTSKERPPERATDQFDKSELTQAFDQIERRLDQLAKTGPSPTLGEAPAFELIPGSDRADVFAEPRKEAVERLEAEIADMRKRKAAPWFEPDDGEWMGRFYLYWHRIADVPCERVAIRDNEPPHDATAFNQTPEHNVDRDRLTIVRTNGLIEDNDQNWRVDCAHTRWGFAYEWARKHGGELLAEPLEAISVFGDTGHHVYPGLAGLSALVRTSDRFLLFALRASERRVKFYPECWSASFEEQFSPDPRKGEFGKTEPDKTLFHTIRGGLWEEFHIPQAAIGATSLIAVGRHWELSDTAGLDLSSTVVAAVQLNITVSQLWAYIRHAIQTHLDADEHKTWVCVRFADRAQIMRFLAFTHDRSEGVDLFPNFNAEDPEGIDWLPFPDRRQVGINDRGLQIASAVRLVLGSAWFEAQDATQATPKD